MAGEREVTSFRVEPCAGSYQEGNNDEPTVKGVSFTAIGLSLRIGCPFLTYQQTETNGYHNELDLEALTQQDETSDYEPPSKQLTHTCTFQQGQNKQRGCYHLDAPIYRTNGGNINGIHHDFSQVRQTQLIPS